MKQAASPIALVRSGDDATAVWHVDVSPSTPLARLCGAWVTNEVSTLRNVLAARPLLPFGGRLTPPAASLVDDSTAMVVDASATLSSIAMIMSELDALHRDSKTAAGGVRAAITWPTLPPALDWAALPAPPRGVNPDPFVAETIAVARWLADLADAWSAIEVARTSRQHLAGGEPTPRPFPTVVVPPDVQPAA